MVLTLRIENYDVLENGGPTSITLRNAGCSVGRGSSNDWILPDPSRHISTHHFDVTFADGAYFITDVSTNGTFLYEQKHRIEGQHRLTNGARFAVGHYIIMAQLQQDAAGLQMPPSVQTAPPSQVPDDGDVWGSFGGPASQAVNPLPSGGGSSARIDDAMGGFVSTPTGAPQQPPQFAPQPPGAGQAFQAPPNAPASMPMPQLNPSSMPPRGETPQMPPAAGLGAQPLPGAAPMTPPVAPDAVVAAFCEGIGLNPADYPGIDAVTLARSVGQCLRTSAQEIMTMLQDRANVKHFTKGGERTMRSATGNNPMKFLPDTDQALEAMFFKPRDGFMNGTDGFDNALKDIRMHQGAVFAALQPALAKVLEGLSPDEIADEAGSGLLGGSSRAKAWESFVERWDTKANTGDNGMLDAFLEAFAKAYSAASARQGAS